MRNASVVFKIIVSGLLLLFAIAGLDNNLFVSASVSLVTPPLEGGVPKPNDWPIRVPWGQLEGVGINQGYGGWLPNGTWNENTAHLGLDEKLSANDYYALDLAIGSDQDGNPNLVLAIAPGRVHFADWATGDTWGGYGRVVYIYHLNGYYSLYAHLSEIFVFEGQPVWQGRELGRVGGSGFKQDDYWGQHLHLAIYQGSNFTIGAGSGKDRAPSGPYGGKAVVPEPLVGKEVYEGFGLQWDGHVGWFGSLEADDLFDDSLVPGSPGGLWGDSATGEGTYIGANQSVNFVVEGLPADTREVRVTAGYDDWSVMDEETDTAVWRILARCWPDRPQEGGCEWSGGFFPTTLSYEWKPTTITLHPLLPGYLLEMSFIQRTILKPAYPSVSALMCLIGQGMLLMLLQEYSVTGLEGGHDHFFSPTYP